MGTCVQRVRHPEPGQINKYLPLARYTLGRRAAACKTTYLQECLELPADLLVPESIQAGQPDRCSPPQFRFSVARALINAVLYSRPTCSPMYAVTRRVQHVSNSPLQHARIAGLDTNVQVILGMLIDNHMQVLFRAHGTRNGELRAGRVCGGGNRDSQHDPIQRRHIHDTISKPLSYCFYLVTIQAFLLLLARWYRAPTARKNDLSTETLSRWSPRYSRAVPGHKFPPDQSAVRLF